MKLPEGMCLVALKDLPKVILPALCDPRSRRSNGDLTYDSALSFISTTLRKVDQKIGPVGREQDLWIHWYWDATDDTLADFSGAAGKINHESMFILVESLKVPASIGGGLSNPYRLHSFHALPINLTSYKVMGIVSARNKITGKMKELYPMEVAICHDIIGYKAKELADILVCDLNKRVQLDTMFDD
jgi:hypothetical protein